MNSSENYLPLIVNLGKELLRFFELKESGEIEGARAAAARARVMIDSLLVCSDLSSGGKWEMEKWQEIIDDALSNIPEFLIKKEDVSSYFQPFAMRLMSV